MEHYTKASSHAAESGEKKEPCDIHVKSGSKIRNVIAQAFRLLQNKKGEKIVLIGSGPTVTKTITCAEIIKRKTKGLHQLNKLFYTKIQDTWEPKEQSLDKLQVTRKVPSISITLSKVPLDATQPGYQAPGKSKSPVQFGDEDWELAWEEIQDDSTKAKQKTNLPKSAKTKTKTKRAVDKGNAETKTETLETASKVVNGTQIDHLDKGAKVGHLKDNICKSQEEQLESGTLGGEQKEEGHLVSAAMQSEQSHEGHVEGGVLKSEQSRERHLESSALKDKQRHKGHQEGCTLESKQSCEGHLEGDGLESKQNLKGHQELGTLESKQSCKGHVESGAFEIDQSCEKHLKGTALETKLEQSNRSQGTEKHEKNSIQKRPNNNSGHKPKLSPRKKQKAEDSEAC